MYHVFLKRFLYVFAFSLSINAFAGDTLSLSVRQADSMFQKHNFNLLAASMEIDVQKAQQIQSGLYPNPVFTADVNAYDPDNNKPFHVGKTGQKSFQLEQLVLLGGKRMAQLDMARTNVHIAELEFQDLVRHLKFQLHSSMYFLSQQSLLIRKYNRQMNMLDTILAAYDVQVKKGNIPLKDVVRLKGVYMGLNNDRAEVFRLYYEELAKVQVIIQSGDVIVPLIQEDDIASMARNLDLQELNNLALSNRPDYLLVQQHIQLAEQYYDFQKRMAVPDVNLFTSYDQRGGAFNNQLNVGISIPLPVWNRNQGQIKASALAVKQMGFNAENVRIQMLAELQSYYSQYTQTVSEFRKTEKLYNADFDVTLKGMADNFTKGNVSLLEFVDFFESYNNAMSEIVRIRIQLANSAEQLNLSTGKTIF
jgi:cobalt-zinc-cadmium efflux system outer membrane protein